MIKWTLRLTTPGTANLFMIQFQSIRCYELLKLKRIGTGGTAQEQKAGKGLELGVHPFLLDPKKFRPLLRDGVALH